MKSLKLGMETGSKLGTLALVAAGALGLSSMVGGCIYVGPIEQVPPNYPPQIIDSELYVYCDYDYQYGDYYWDFVSFVDDYNGRADVRDVFVDVVDTYVDPYHAIERWELVYDGNGWWSNRIYEYYSSTLSCGYFYDFEFDFFAYDYYGASDSVTYIP